ncbi:MAG: hypothetical protein CR986_06265 [Ignavibacteriae bacterium]|nr:MAG: hypothetical protein CR986_06265 [Ignavibacteriota bacterium]
MKAIFLKLFLVVLVLFVSTSNSQTRKTGTTAAQILKLNVGARAIGLGGAYTSIADDISSIYWNPGGTSNIAFNSAYFSHSDLYADIKHEFAAFSSKLGDIGTIGLFVDVLDMGEMAVRRTDKPEGTGEIFDAGAVVIGLNYARYLTNNFSIGFNFKYINENIWHMSSTGFAADIGVLYKLDVLNQLRIAASISNFGTKMRLSGRDITNTKTSGAGDKNLINTNIQLDQFDLPLLFRFGISNDVIKEQNSRLTIAIDAVTPNDHTSYLNLGTEYGWNETVFLRVGYNSLFEEASEKGLTAGVGFYTRLMDLVKVKFDYSYQDFGRLKEVHYFSIGVDF